MSFTHRIPVAKSIARAGLVLSTLLVLIIAFQNCSMSTYAKSFPVLNNYSKVVGGNGEPYDGKLSGYSRLVPGLSCENKKVKLGTLDIHGDFATIVSNENSCLNISEEVPVTQLEKSSFSDKYIGYGGGVYTYLNNRAENINKEIFTEAWCRGMKSDGSGSDVEFAAEWQQAGRSARFVKLTKTEANPSMTSADRTIDEDRVTYQTDEGTLVINFKQHEPENQKVSGVYYSNHESSNSKINVQCLMGGQFDLIAPTFDYPLSPDQTLAVGENFPIMLPIVSKPVVQFTISDPLPEGIYFDVQTGMISGAARFPSPRRNYVISAIFNFGEITRQIAIGIGTIQMVDKATVSHTALPCRDDRRDCDLAGAVAKAKQQAPLPLIVRLSAPKIDFEGIRLEIGGDMAIMGLDSLTTLDAHSLSQHFNLQESAHLDLKNLVLSNGLGRFGGSISASRAAVVINNSQFINNLAEDASGIAAGGAIAADEGSLFVFNSKFLNNNAGGKTVGYSYSGGAISIGSPLRVSIKNTLFKNNFSPDGGALSFYHSIGKNIEIENCDFQSNSAVRGGAILDFYSELVIKNSRFSSNSATAGAAAIDVSGGFRSWVSGSQFTDNTGYSVITFQGNPVQLTRDQAASLYVLESNFSNNKVTTALGSTIMAYNSRLVLRGDIFSNNIGTLDCSAVDLIYTNPLLQTTPSEIFSLGGNITNEKGCLK